VAFLICRIMSAPGVKYTVTVIPIHFRLDLNEPDRGGAAEGAPSSLTVMLMFKGTEWQVSDLRLSNLSSKVALAPKQNAIGMIRRIRSNSR
jgi:hypothetical protein